MNLAPTKIKPSPSKGLFFNGDDLESCSFEHSCSSCGSVVPMGGTKIWKGAWSWEKQFTETEVLAIVDFWKFDPNKNIALERGWPSVSRHTCQSCHSKFILLADFHEYRNSVYKIVIQGIAHEET